MMVDLDFESIIELNVEDGRLYNMDNGERIRIGDCVFEPIPRAPPLTLIVGDNYIPGGGFSNLGKIPEDAVAILVGGAYRNEKIEVFSGVYYRESKRQK